MTVMKEYTALLSRMAQEEYTDAILYLREAALFQKKLVGGRRLGVFFNGYAESELHHADVLASQLIALGYPSVMQVQYLENEKSLRRVLARHLTRERAAEAAYGALIGMAPAGSFRTMLKSIRAEEQEHEVRITHILGKIR